MSEPFVAQLRARGTALQIVADGAPSITVRIEMPEVWDTVKAEVSPNTPVRELKRRALEALYPVDEPVEEFVLKLRGWEVLNEDASIADVGGRDGSIFLLTFRRRRAVR
ncbi:MAG: hypothetical protein JWL61_1105 [Gemmatimonadetes bacterium]|jgi:hypothetical protein|nr:hypothetical protein [Gemmatimonadota bacterium]